MKHYIHKEIKFNINTSSLSMLLNKLFNEKVMIAMLNLSAEYNGQISSLIPFQKSIDFDGDFINAAFTISIDDFKKIAENLLNIDCELITISNLINQDYDISSLLRDIKINGTNYLLKNNICDTICTWVTNEDKIYYDGKKNTFI